MSPITRRRLALFRQNRRGFWSAVVLGILLLITLPAEFVANDHASFRTPVVASVRFTSTDQK